MNHETAVTIGTFDGVHRGHQAILQRVRDYAHQMKLEPIAYAFSFPPRFSVPGPHLILTASMKEILLRRYVKRVVAGEFAQVHALTPMEFFSRVIVGELHARAIVVGADFRFGRDRSGDAELLRTMAVAAGIEAIIVPPVMIDGAPVSSTRIRALIQAGRVTVATRLLGRPPVIAGTVVSGDRIGRALGYPTANLALPPTLLRPGTGIYLGYAVWESGHGYALIYSGTRPTIGGGEMRVEVYLLIPPATALTGTTMEVHLLERLRDDRSFPSLDALAAQIAVDVAAARVLIPTYPRPRSILFPDDHG